MPLLTDEQVGLFPSPSLVSDADVGLTMSSGDALTPENYGAVAAARIAKARRERQEASGEDLNPNEQAAIMDAYRQAAGLPTLSQADTFKETQQEIAKHQSGILNLARATSAAFMNQAVNLVAPAADLISPRWGQNLRLNIAAVNPFDPSRFTGKAGGAIASVPLLLAGGGLKTAAGVFGLQSLTQGLATADDTGVTGTKKWLGAAGQGAITAAAVLIGGKLAGWATETIASRLPKIQALLAAGDKVGVAAILKREAVGVGINLPTQAAAMLTGTVADNFLAQATTDPSRKWDDGLGETAFNVAAMTIGLHTVRIGEALKARGVSPAGPRPTKAPPAVQAAPGEAIALPVEPQGVPAAAKPVEIPTAKPTFKSFVESKGIPWEKVSGPTQDAAVLAKMRQEYAESRGQVPAVDSTAIAVKDTARPPVQTTLSDIDPRQASLSSVEATSTRDKTHSAEGVSVAGLAKVVTGAFSASRQVTNAIVGSMSGNLRSTKAGRALEIGLDRASNKAASLVGRVENEITDSVQRLTREDRDWLSAMNDRGHKNIKLLLETDLQPPNERIAAWKESYRRMVAETGIEAERVGMQRITDTGEVIDFQRAKEGRFLRTPTPDAWQAWFTRTGPVYDAIRKAVARENNLTLDEVSTILDEWLGPESVRKVGALERIRKIKVFPEAVKVGNKWVDVLETDPYTAALSGAERMARRIYFVEQFGQNIKGETTLVEAIRSAHLRGGGTTGDVDRVLEVWNHRPYKRVFSDPHAPVARAIRIADQVVRTAQTSLSVVPNIPQTMMLVPAYTGPIAYLKAVVEVIRHPKQTAAQLASMGAMHRSVMDWTIRQGHVPEDITRVASGIFSRTTGLHWVSMFNNMAAGQAFKTLAHQWSTAGFQGNDSALAKQLRLRPAEIAQIKAGNMTVNLANKIVQNGVKITQFITEDPHRMSHLQQIPLLKSLFDYNNYAIGTIKALSRLTVGITKATVSGTPAERRGAAGQLASVIVGAVGAGTLSLFLRRMVKGQDIVQADESAVDVLKKSLWEVAVLGPVQRLGDAWDYSSNTSEKLLTGLSPKIRFLMDTTDAVLGTGTYGRFPPGRRLEEFFKKEVPIVRAAYNQLVKAMYPNLIEYTRVAALVRKYQKDMGLGSKALVTQINPEYDAVRSAIRRQDDDGAREAIAGYTQRHLADEDGGEKAAAGLKQALMLASPVPFTGAEELKFLNSLSPDDRQQVEQIQGRYTDIIDEVVSIERRAAKHLRVGDPGPLIEAVESGQVSLTEARTMAVESRQTSIQQKFTKANAKETVRMWEQISPAEREQVRPIMLEKLRNYVTDPSHTETEKRAVVDQYREKGLLE